MTGALLSRQPPLLDLLAPYQAENQAELELLSHLRAVGWIREKINSAENSDDPMEILAGLLLELFKKQ